MNRREITEIRKQFSPERCCISRICGCCVDGEKNIRMQTREAFGALPEEEALKYFSIFAKTLSGKTGRNLYDVEFPVEAEAAGGPQEFLLRLRDSGLREDELLNEFFRKVTENYTYPDSYYIILIQGAYDIPGKAGDGTELFDASDDVYEFLLCSICPVKLSKPGLIYQEKENRIRERVRDRVVEKPMHGFLFPAFSDRQTDIHGMLYSCRKAEDLQPGFLQAVAGCPAPFSAEEQKAAFHRMITGVLGEDADYAAVNRVYAELAEMMCETADSPESAGITRSGMRRLLEAGGVPECRMQAFEEISDEVQGDDVIQAENIISGRDICIRTADVEIRVKKDRPDLVENRMIDGRPCLVVAVDSMAELNGMPVRLFSREE